jgi:hypothetical protein
MVMDFSSVAEIHLQKAVSIKNSQTSVTIIYLTAMVTVLFPLLITEPEAFYGIIIIMGVYSGFCAYLSRFLNLRYEEHMKYHYMFFSVYYFENKLNVCPDVFKRDPVSMYAIAKKMSDEFVMNGEKIFESLILYYFEKRKEFPKPTFQQ